MDQVLKIDRSQTFNPAEFIGKGWRIVEQDERSLALTEVDLSKVELRHMLKPGEIWVYGEAKLDRLKAAGHIRLDAKVYQTLRENPELIPEKWKEKTRGNFTFVCFDGTVLSGPDGDRLVLCLFWHNSQWHQHFVWLKGGWASRSPSAVLAG